MAALKVTRASYEASKLWNDVAVIFLGTAVGSPEP